MGILVYPAPAGAKEEKLVTIKSTQSWTAPAGVTYVIAEILGGGGGGGSRGSASGSAGTASSAFSETGNGARGGTFGTTATDFAWGGGQAAPANSGAGGGGNSDQSGTLQYNEIAHEGGDAQFMKIGAVVVPGTAYTITVGGGGAGGGTAGAGGSGVVFIRYWV